MSKVTFLAQEISYKAVQVVKSPKVRFTVLLIALVSSGFVFAGDDSANGG